MSIKKSVSEHKNLFLLIITLVIFRIGFLDMVSTNGDPDAYWQAAKTILSDSGTVVLEHHSSRFTVTAIVTLFQYIFGTKAIVYFLPGLFLNIIQILLLYKLARLLFDENVALVSSVFFMSMPLLFLPGYAYNMHIYPAPYSITFVLAAFLMLFKFLSHKNYKYIILCSLMMFLAYGSKITNVFFFIPMVFILKKDVKAMVLLGSVFAFLFGAETLFYNIAYNIRLGRLGVILSNHLADTNTSLETFASPLVLFRRLYDIKLPHLIIFILFYISSIYYLIRSRNTSIRRLILIVYAFLFSITFAVTGINPVKPMLPFNTRYLNVLLPFIAILLSYSAVRVITSRAGQHTHQIINRTVHALLLLIVTASLAGIIIMNRDHNIAKIIQYNNMVQSAYENDIPIVTRDDEKHENTKGLKVARDVFIEDYVSDTIDIASAQVSGKDIIYLRNNSKPVLQKIDSLDTKVLIIERSPFSATWARFEEL